MEKFLTWEDILDLIKSFARSQGSYGRLYEAWTTCSEEEQAAMKAYLESKKFKSGLDFIMAYEGWEL